MNQKKKTPVLVRKNHSIVYLVNLDEPVYYDYLQAWNKDGGHFVLSKEQIKESEPLIDTPEAQEIIKEYEHRFGVECKNVKKFKLTYKLKHRLWGIS